MQRAQMASFTKTSPVQPRLPALGDSRLPEARPGGPELRSSGPFAGVRKWSPLRYLNVTRRDGPCIMTMTLFKIPSRPSSRHLQCRCQWPVTAPPKTSPHLQTRALPRPSQALLTTVVAHGLRANPSAPETFAASTYSDWTCRQSFRDESPTKALVCKRIV